MSKTNSFVYRVSYILCLFFAVFFATPAFAGSQKLALVPKDVAQQQQQFHSVLDAYLAATTSLEKRIQESTTLDEATRNHLLAIVQTEKSEFLNLRSKLYSTSAKREVQQLAKEAQKLRAAAKLREDRIVLPLLTLASMNASLIPTAAARLESMDTTLTKAQYDRAAKELAAVQSEVKQLHDALLGKRPPVNAMQRVQLLQTRMKNLYRDLRSTLK